MSDLPEGVYLRHPDSQGMRGCHRFDNVAVRDGKAIFEWNEYCGFGDKPDPEYYGVVSSDTIVKGARVFQTMDDYLRYAEASVLPQEMLTASPRGSTGTLSRNAHQCRDQYD